MTVWITLDPGADLSRLQAELQGLGLWTRPAEGLRGGVGLRVEGHSSRVSADVISQLAGVLDVHREPSPHPLVDAQAGLPVPLGNGVELGGGVAPVLMAGPCSVESRLQIIEAAHLVASAGAALLRGGAFKPRSSPYAFQGVGVLALGWMREAADSVGLGVVTEVLGEADVEPVAEVADLIQVGSRNMQNFALLRAVGAAGKAVLLKRGSAAPLEEWLLSAEHLLLAGASRVVFCERGLKSFDVTTRNLLDLGTVALLKWVHRQPVVVDPSHAAGRTDLVVPLARAAVAAGADGLVLEVHPDPTQARSDGPQALRADGLRLLVRELERMRGNEERIGHESGRYAFS